MTNNMKNTMNKNKTQYGGGLFDLLKEKLMPSDFKEYGHIMGTAIHSENEFITAYEEYTRAAKHYFATYNKHLEHLKALEESKNIPSLVDMFKTKVIPNDFKNKLRIDRSNPLLLNNYLVTDNTLPKNFKKEHVINQIRYTVSKFNPTDKILVDSIGNVSIDGTTCKFTIKMGTGDKFDLSTKINTDYVIDMNDVEEQVREVIAKIKGKLDFDIELIDDFQVDTEELEIPGITYDKPENINALDAKLRELDFVKSIKANRSESDIGPSSDKPKPIKPERREFDIFGRADAIAEEKKKEEEAERRRLAELDREALRDIGADAQLNPDEYKKQFPEVADQLKNIFAEPEAKGDGEQQIQQMQQQPNYPMRTFGQQMPTPGFLQQQPFNFGMMGTQQPQQMQQPDIVDPDEAYCRTMSANPEACKIDPKCFYSANIPNPERRCHKDVKGIPK
jgi:hypothetical protein